MTKFNLNDLEAALSALAMLKYWPSDPATRAEIGGLLARMVPHREALQWLVRVMVDRIGEWPGPAELRALLCTRYRPADGIERDCSIPGYRPQDYEAQAIERHIALKAGAIAPASLEIVRLAGGRR